MSMKRKTIVWLGILGGLLLLCGGAGLALRAAGGHLEVKLPVQHTPLYAPPTGARFPLALTARGNRLEDPDGKPVRLRGLMPPDSATLERKGQFQAETFARMRALGANVVRLPVFPEDWSKDPDYLWRYLDKAATWSGENGLYLIIDWHYIGNMASGEGPKMPQLSTPANQVTLAFWRQTAGYFRDTPHVIFEIFNEPQAIGADEWRAKAGEVVQAIRAQGARQLIIVGGIEYGKDLSWVLEGPVSGENIAYASHIYPAHPPSAWETYFGHVAQVYPVLITEWGYLRRAEQAEDAYLLGDEGSYGAPLLEALDQARIGWVACWYDDTWLPAMFEPGGKETNEYGDFVLRKLREAN
jgi:endoglucanase